MDKTADLQIGKKLIPNIVIIHNFVTIIFIVYLYVNRQNPKYIYT